MSAPGEQFHHPEWLARPPCALSARRSDKASWKAHRDSREVILDSTGLPMPTFRYRLSTKRRGDLTGDQDYSADLTDIPDEVMDRIGMRSLADATLFIDQLAEAGCALSNPKPEDRSDVLPRLLMQQYGWSRHRSLHAILAMEAIMDARDGGPDIDMIERIEATLALLGPLSGDEGGVSCAFSVRMDRLRDMIDDGRMQIVTKH
jgi:hypothetical protein